MIPDIGAAIIVKDGCKTIETAIKSLQGVCRQIVVIDTGSADDTPSIVSRMGCELYFHKWNDNFAEARNISLTYMRTEWIVVLDADEELVKGSMIFQNFLFENESTGGIKVNIENPLGDAETGEKTVHKYPRIFRNRSGIRFEGAIHEQINESIAHAGFNIVDSDIKIIHYGYADKSSDRIERNRELLNKEITANPDDAWAKFHLAETEFAGGALDVAEKLFIDSLELGGLGQEQTELAKIRLGQIALSKDDYDKAEEALNFGSRDINREGLRKYVLAAIRLMQKKYSEALALYKSPEIKLSGLVDKNQLEEAIEKLPVIRF